MRYFCSFLLLLLTTALHAQTTRFIYQVTLLPDSTDTESRRTERAYLDVEGQKSYFYAENRMKRDSLIARVRETGNLSFDRSQMQALRSLMDFTIEKDLAAQKRFFESRILRDTYRYAEERPLEWQILTQTADIGGYKTQMAETDFAGRKWRAWFTTDIPLQDGPYKFSGLPGLIIKAEDSKGDYSFDLLEVKKVGSPVNFRRGTVLQVSRKDYLKKLQQFQNDPAAQLGRHGIRITMDPAQRREREERIKEQVRKNNNPLELK